MAERFLLLARHRDQDKNLLATLGWDWDRSLDQGFGAAINPAEH